MAYFPLQSEFRASELKEASSVVDGFQSQIDAMVPGMTTQIGYTGLNGTFTVSLNGNLVVARVGETVIAEQVPWDLPTMSLQPGAVYTLRLDGSELFVEKGGVG